jgi:cell wall-associated NlpC family hydrolase
MPLNFPRHRRVRVRTGAAAAAVGLAFSGLVLVAPRADAAEPTPTKITVSPARASKSIGTGVTFTFTLSSGTRTVGGHTVAIYTRPAGVMQWTKRWTHTLNSNGQTKAAFTVQRSTYVQARFAGTSRYAKSVSSSGYVQALDAFGKRVIAEAATHRGKPYQWGATGPSRFDCSGFTMYVFGRFGKRLPHNSGQQYNSIRHVAKADKRVGDLIFTYNSSGIYHVAIYAGNGEIWHAPHSGDVVKRSALWSNSYYVGRVA